MWPLPVIATGEPFGSMTFSFFYSSLSVSIVTKHHGGKYFYRKAAFWLNYLLLLAVIMPKTQTKTTRSRRFWAWLGRHKVTAGFMLLVLIGVLYLAISAIVLQVQIHIERKQFDKASQRIDFIQNNISATDNPRPLRSNFCSYTSPPSIFTVGVRSCDVQLKILYRGLDRVESVKLSNNMHNMLNKQFIDLKQNKDAYESGDLAVYDFENENLSCLYVSTYYDQTTLSSSRDSAAPQSGVALFMEIDCSGGAKAEYFPVNS